MTRHRLIKQSQKQEKRIAKDVGGARVAGSGSKWYAKGDVRSDGFLVEAKTTGNKSFPVTQKVLEKISLEAVKTGRIPVLAVEFTGGEKREQFALLSWSDFLYLMENLKNGDQD